MKRIHITNQYALNLAEIQALPLYAEHECQWEPHPVLHHLQICSGKKCGKVRSAFVWTGYDDMEAEFMERQEELYAERDAELSGYR